MIRRLPTAPLERMLGWITLAYSVQFFVPGAANSIMIKAYDIYGPTWAWGIVWVTMGVVQVAGSFLDVLWLKRLKLVTLGLLWGMLLLGLAVDQALSAANGMALMVLGYVVLVLGKLRAHADD